MSMAAIKANLAKVGEDPVLQAEKAKTDEAQAAISALDPAALSPSAMQGTVTAKADALDAEVGLGDVTELNLKPDLTSLTEEIMGAIENPTAGGIASLQSLTDSAGIKPPGLGLPSIPSSVPGAPDLDLGISSGGGFDINSALGAADGLVQQPSLTSVETMLPDIGADAPTDLTGKVPGGLPQGTSGGLTNPFKTFGNIQLKNDFDKDGNPIKVPFEQGQPAVVPRAAVRAEPTPPGDPVAPPPKETTLLRGNSKDVPPAHRTGVIYDDDGNPVDPAVAVWMDRLLKKGGVKEGINRDLSGLPLDNPGQPDTDGVLPYNTKLEADLPLQIKEVDNNIFMKQIKDSGSFAGGIFDLKNVNGETDVKGLIEGIDITTLPQSGEPASEHAKNLRRRGDQETYTKKAKKGPQGAGNVRKEDRVIVRTDRSGRTTSPDTVEATPEQAENLHKLKEQLFPGFGEGLPKG